MAHPTDENIYYNLKNEILNLYSMFGTTYNSKVAFSNLKIIVDKLWNKLSGRHINDLMRIKGYKRDLNLDELGDRKCVLFFANTYINQHNNTNSYSYINQYIYTLVYIHTYIGALYNNICTTQ